MADVDDRVFTLAVWDVGRRQWAAFCTSKDRKLIDGLDAQLGSLVMVFTVVVEVPRSDDDAVVAALGMLPLVHPEAVFRSYFDLVELVSLDGPRRRPVGH